MDCHFITEGQPYRPDQIIEVLVKAVPNNSTVKNNKKIEYFNIPVAFDIETSSFYNSDNRKQVCMYEWTFGINGYVIIGRYWVEFLQMIEQIKNHLSLNLNRRLIIYVHNLAYEFQFIRKFFEWDKVFSISERKPIYGITSDGIEFRCSYLLTGYSLDNLGKELLKYKVEKKVGDLDYSLIRHSETPLTDKELGYCINDVRVVMSCIQEKIENEGDITRIPITKTGYVRQYCRDKCYKTDGSKDVNKTKKYREIMKSLTLSVEEYEQLKRAFQGGFTHASSLYSRKTVANVKSFDFTSSYPAVMLSEQFPMSSSKQVTIDSEETLNKYLNKYCCMFDIEFYNFENKNIFEHPLSSSRCYNKKNCIEDNGRVVRADYFWTTLTEQDYFLIKEYYSWENCGITNFRIYRKNYLPKDFILAILDLYKDKTELKGVKGREVEYQLAKGMINACYGMTVTDIARDEILYEEENWNTANPDLEEVIEKYNKSKNRFLFYPWGVWITAYARRNLFSAISELKTDYIYADTDSVKFVNYDNHKDYFDRYNKNIEAKLKLMCDRYNIDFERVQPKTIKGEKKLLGVWDDEGVYTYFKTLGAKRYMTFRLSENELSLTISGLNKVKAIPYILDQCNIKYESKEYQLPKIIDTDNILKAFDYFDDDMTIPTAFTGVNTHTYIDDVMEGSVTDYLGNTAEYQELSGVHIEGSSYSLSLSQQYLNYLRGVKDDKQT